MLLLLACISDSEPYFGLSRAHEPATTLVFNNSTEPEYLDPTQATGHPDGRIIGELFDGLTEYDPVDLSPRPSHAASWEVHPDGRGYTFRLREDAVWTDGSPVTTADYLWSWERVLNPVYLGRYAQQLYTVERAQLYNENRALRGDDGRELEALSNDLALLTQEHEGLEEGWTVLRTEGGVRYRPACPDLADLGALLDCEGEWTTVSVPEEALTTTWPTPNQRVLSAAAGPLERGDDIIVISWGEPSKVYGPSKDWTGEVPRAAIADPRGPLVTVRVRELPPVSWLEADALEAVEEAPWEPWEGELPLSSLRSDPAMLGFRALDDKTLEVRLWCVAPYFLQLTSHTSLRPANQGAWEEHGPRWTHPDNIVSNGPFTLTEHKVRDRFVLDKNPTWWGVDTLQLDRVIAYSIDNLNTSANLYRAGETDLIVANDTPSEFIPMLRTKQDFHVSPALSVYVYRLNTTEPPLDDVRVRRALAMAIDRSDIVSVLKAGQVPANHIVPPGIPGYEGPSGPDFDPEEARRLLAEAGYPGGQGFPELNILYNTLESHKLVAAVVQDQWAKHLGITVQLENREWKTYLKTVNSLDYDIARGGWIGDFLDPMTFLELWIEDGGNNNTGWSDPAYEALLRQAAMEPDLAQRAAVLGQAEALLNEQVPFIPIYWYVWAELAQPDVRGMHPNLLDQHPLRYVSLER